jgi:hypothetical protein
MNPNPTHGELWSEIRAMRDENALAHKAIRIEVNNISDDLVIMRDDLRTLNALRQKGIGFLAAIGLVGALLILGLKTWVKQVTGAG